jgi:hypothetical protein
MFADGETWAGWAREFAAPETNPDDGTDRTEVEFRSCVSGQANSGLTLTPRQLTRRRARNWMLRFAALLCVTGIPLALVIAETDQKRISKTSSKRSGAPARAARLVSLPPTKAQNSPAPATSHQVTAPSSVTSAASAARVAEVVNLEASSKSRRSEARQSERRRENGGRPRAPGASAAVSGRAPAASLPASDVVSEAAPERPFEPGDDDVIDPFITSSQD